MWNVNSIDGRKLYKKKGKPEQKNTEMTKYCLYVYGRIELNVNSLRT
jgi:hypothetical protein